MTIEVLRERGVSQRAIARQLGVHENAVRYSPGWPSAAPPARSSIAGFPAGGLRAILGGSRAGGS